MPTIHFIIYAISAGVGILVSILVVCLGLLYENAVINYFLSLTASLVITPLFAYFIDVANSRIQKTTLQEKRVVLLNPLIGTISAALGRTFIIWNYAEFQDKKITYDNIEECIDILLDKYVISINKLCYQRDDIKLINECFNIKQWEEYGFRETEKQLKSFLDNQIALVSENVISSREYLFLNPLYDAVTKARLPYLTMVQDKNISKATVDWPAAPLSEIDVNNLHSSFKLFISVLKTTIMNISEFASIKELQIQPVEK